MQWSSAAACATWAEVSDATIAILDATTFADLATRASGRWTDVALPTPGVKARRLELGAEGRRRTVGGASPDTMSVFCVD